MPSYRISGLTVAAEMTLPGAIAIPESSGRADIIIRRRPVPEQLSAPTLRGPLWELDSQSFLLRLPGIARFLASVGQTLDIDPEPGYEIGDTLIFALGTCMGALLYQRGAVVLHASAIALDGMAYAFCGRSGIGKSTLAAALCRSGCGFVSDDVSAIGLDGDGRPGIWPDGRQLKLFEKSIAALDMASRQQANVRSVIDKFYVEPPQPGSSQAMPLKAVHILTEDRFCAELQIELLTRLDAAQGLQNESYRPRLALAMARTGLQMPVTAALVHHVQVFRLVRPTGLDHLTDIVAALKAKWRNLSAEPHDAITT